MSGARAPGPLVIKLGGAAIEHPAPDHPLLAAIADLHARERREGGGVVVVHGGGAAVDGLLARLGIVTQRRQGLRVTGDAEIDIVVGVLAGTLNKRLVGALLARGSPAVGLCLGDGGATLAALHQPEGADLGRVGRVSGGEGCALRALMDAGFMPVLAPIGFDDSGSPLNINGDEAASGVARALGARLLVLLTDVQGVLDEHGELIPRLDSARAAALIDAGVIWGGMIPKVRAALEASSRAGAPVLIAGWDDASAIARLGSDEPSGTLVSAGTSASGAQGVGA